MKPNTLAQLVATLQRHGQDARLRGNADSEIRAIATLEEAQAGQLSFLSNPKYEKLLQTTAASAVVVRPGIAVPERLAAIEVADPYAAITILIVECYGYRRHRRPNFVTGPALSARPEQAAEPLGANIAGTAQIGPGATIYPGATIDEDVRIGANAVIYPGVYVGPRCRVGDGVTLYPNTVIYEDCVIGHRVTIHAGSVIGNDGLGYAPVGGRWVKIPQIGIVELGDDVEIGANCSIDRATLGRTKIGSGTKFSNLIAIGHGTQIGEHCMFVAQVGLAGSVQVGHHVTMAGQAGVVGHIRVGDNATVGAKAGVTNSVPDGETVLGAPAIPIREMKRLVVYQMRLGELFDDMRRLDKEIALLREQLNKA